MSKPEKFICPHCKVTATKGRFERWHGDNCSVFVRGTRSKTPEYAFDINKYTELHEDFIKAVGVYYNNHIAFMNRPSLWMSKNLVWSMNEIPRTIKAIKKNNIEVRLHLKEQTKKRKAVIAEKKLNKGK